MLEIHVEYAVGEVHCHDAAGWRRARAPARPEGWPVKLRPDWVCEIVSPRHERRDHVDKPQVLHAAEVPYYWLMDPEEKILLVQRRSRRSSSTSPSCSETSRRRAGDEPETR
jgi:Uma2 family endonuclease